MRNKKIFFFEKCDDIKSFLLISSLFFVEDQPMRKEKSMMHDWLGSLDSYQ